MKQFASYQLAAGKGKLKAPNWLFERWSKQCFLHQLQVDSQLSITFKHKKTVVCKTKAEQREQRGEEHDHPWALSVFCEHLKLELFTEQPAMNNPFTDAHSKEDSKHPAAELNERKGASWPSEKETINIVTVLKTLLNRTTKKGILYTCKSGWRQKSQSSSPR